MPNKPKSKVAGKAKTPPKKVAAKIRTKRLSDGTLLRVYMYGERKPKGKK